MQVSAALDVTFDDIVALTRLSSAPLPQTESSIVASNARFKPLTPPAHRCPGSGCNRHFNRKYTLMEHMTTHTGRKPHVCPVKTCGKRFSTSGNLSRHKRLHGYIEPLQCPVEGCLSSFPSNCKLEKHMKFHLGSAVHVCTIDHCGKTFSTVGNLNRHVKHQHMYDVLPSSSEYSASSPTSASSYTALLFESSTEISQLLAIDVSSLPQCTLRFQKPPVKALTTCHSDEMVDVLTEIFHEAVAQPGDTENLESHAKISILDDMISFHVDYLS